MIRKSIIIIIELICIQHFARIDHKFAGIVPTSKGSIQGKSMFTIGKGVEYTAFLGIPYAKPPIGYRRFKPPEEVDPWMGIYQATEESTMCPQQNFSGKSAMGSEDCLHLNVYTPKIDHKDTKLRAVMVWIHGGAFKSGSKNLQEFGPDFVIEEDVVVVAINYRLGVLGFLSLNHENASGNAGLKDQKLALKWVQRNIRSFGGDPEKVTIAGHSAGSISVLLHMISEESRGLFRAAIAMSGTPLNYWSVSSLPDAVERGFAVGRHLGMDTSNVSVLLQQLYEASSAELVMAVASLTQEILLFSKPTIEDPKVSPAPFLTKCPFDTLKSGNFSPIPLIIGFVRSETMLFMGTATNLRDIVNLALEATDAIPSMQSSETKFLMTMRSRSSSDINGYTAEEIYMATNLTTSITFVEGIDRVQRILAAKSAPVYYYRNSFDYSEASHKLSGNKFNGTSHGDDILHFAWQANAHQSLDPESDIGIQRSRLTRMWTNFVKYGNPTPDGDSDPLLKINWPVSDSEGTYLEINKNFTVGTRPIDEFAKFVQRATEPYLSEVNGCQ